MGRRTQKAPKISRPTPAPSLRRAPEPARNGPIEPIRRATDAGNLQVMDSLGMRAKLPVSMPGDADEVEADRVADAFVSGDRLPGMRAERGSPWQRACVGCETLSLRRSPESGGNAAAAGAGPVGDAVTRAMRASQGTTMPERLRSEFAGFFGDNLSNVRLHTGAEAQGAASMLSAQAFTRGNDIYFNQGRFAPESRDGRRLLAHEIAHTLQPEPDGGGASLRRITDADLGMQAEAAEERRRREEAARRRHLAWQASARERFASDVEEHTGDIDSELARSEMTLEVERAAMFDAAREAGVVPVPENLREFYAGATQATLAIGVGVHSGAIEPEVEDELRPVMVDYYLQLTTFARSVEAHQRDREAGARARLERETRSWEMQRAAMHEGLGEPGARAALGGWALANPRPTLQYSAPAPVSPALDDHLQRATSAADVAAWLQVLRDFDASTARLDQLLLYLLPRDNAARQRYEYAALIHARLDELGREHPLAVRIPAIFYPRDRFVRLPNGDAEVAEGMPWQFYLYHTGVTTRDLPARAGGEWVLVDITSPQHVAVNRISSPGLDAAMFQQGAAVNPPIEMFEELNSSLRFPEGQLIFRMPTGDRRIIETTEPWSISDWLQAIGFALGAIALIAGIVVTGGLAAPAAIPALTAIGTAAGLGAAGFNIASTLTGLEERRSHGLLTERDIDAATISIAIDVAGALSLGLGRLVASASRAGVAAGTAARLAAFSGRGWFLVQRAAQLATAASLAGDAYQIITTSADFVRAYRAIQSNPRLSEEERRAALVSLVGRSLLTGGLLAISVRSNVHDLRQGATLHLVDIDADGRVLVSAAHPDVPRVGADAGSGPHPPVDTADVSPGGNTHSLSEMDGTVPNVEAASVSSRTVTTGAEPETHPTARQADEAPPVGAALDSHVHARASRTHAELTLAGEPHGVSVAGRGRMRGFYFCSNECSELLHRLELLLSALPSNFPNRDAYRSLRNRLRSATARLRSGALTTAQGDAAARGFAEELERLCGAQPAVARLLNLAPSDLQARAPDLRRELAATAARGEGIAEIFDEAQGIGTAPVRREPGEPGGGATDLESDVLTALGLGRPAAIRASPGGRASPLHFDVGNFGHMYAEVLVPGLPHGLSSEVVIDLGGGVTRRADRVHFERNADGAVTGGTVFEIKPDTARWRREGLRQAESYAHYLSEIYGGTWNAVCLTYDADAVRRLVRQLRVTPP